MEEHRGGSEVKYGASLGGSEGRSGKNKDLTFPNFNFCVVSMTPDVL